MSVEALCRRCRDGVTAAHGAVASGNLLDLAGLDGEIARMCDALTEVPREERGAAAAALRQLVAELDLLTAALAEQQARLHEAADQDARERAIEAYGRGVGESGKAR